MSERIYTNTKERDMAIAKEASTGNYSLRKLGNMFGLSRTWVNKICRDYGVDISKVVKEKKTKELLDYFNDGGTLDSIEKDLGLNKNTAQSRIQALKISGDVSKINRAKKEKEQSSRVAMVRAFLESGHSKQEAAKHFNVSVNTIYYWLRQNLNDQ